MDELARRRQARMLAQSSQPLWREALGARLRRLRKHRRLTLNDVAQEAGLSSQYLSEIERGRKEPSSEMIAAITGALGISLVELTVQVADELRRDTLSFVGFAPSASPVDTTALPPSSEALPALTSHTISAGPSAAVQLCVAA